MTILPVERSQQTSHQASLWANIGLVTPATYPGVDNNVSRLVKLVYGKIRFFTPSKGGEINVHVARTLAQTLRAGMWCPINTIRLSSRIALKIVIKSFLNLSTSDNRDTSPISSSPTAAGTIVTLSLPRHLTSSLRSGFGCVCFGRSCDARTREMSTGDKFKDAEKDIALRVSYNSFMTEWLLFGLFAWLVEVNSSFRANWIDGRKAWTNV
mmetsp:Transcript_12726/g.19059  ORF Transcript_12726/g.19059 Transcript_12726/m.19059 type:complete len:211 (-) Transcript_12726:413-1045(-)